MGRGMFFQLRVNPHKLAHLAVGRPVYLSVTSLVSVDLGNSALAPLLSP
jgi:hypothetical protein